MLNLLMEFTPFTGLRLRVPLQWVPIQLNLRKWYNGLQEQSPADYETGILCRMVHKWLDTISANCDEVTVQSPQDYVFWKNIEWSFTARKPPMNRK